jgi:hypothetical protein
MGTLLLPSWERGQRRPAQRGVHRRPLTALPARPSLTPAEALSVFQGFVLGGFFSARPDQGLPRRISRWNAGVPPLIYSIPRGGTMIHLSISRVVAGRPGAQSEARFRLGRNQRATRATGRANQLRGILARAQHPMQPYGQAAGDGHFRHPAHAPPLQWLIGAVPLGDRGAPIGGRLRVAPGCAARKQAGFNMVRGRKRFAIATVYGTNIWLPFGCSVGPRNFAANRGRS